ncbi:uncharacterized protein LOC103569155 [Trichonephila clavipes]|nr:uncharacterized protein LOC103569155 [Trichonephila clavipes]
MKIGNNGNLVLGPFDESTPCLLIVLMNCQTKLRINHLTAVKSVAILEKELCETNPFTNEEIACENLFKRTHTRDSTGTFAVNFPFRDSSDDLGSSRDTSVHRLQQIEHRFSKNKSLSDQYHKFMNDYLKLGHMELIPEKEIDVPASFSFYLPHHPVSNKNGDKFRVVFDGSAKSSSGISLNDKLMVGPQLQMT